MNFDKTYNPHNIETQWYRIWEENGYFSPAENATEPYCIMIPPPNVTGSLHMGHAFQDTIMDALIRYHRMKGRKTLWQPGTDHAGIATQMVVERLINAEGKSRHEYGREKFVEKVWEWKEKSGGTIAEQLRRLGASPDWANERFTMDPGLSDAVSRVFVELYDDGIIYRGKRLVNWDPVLHTALSDLEVISVEEKGHLWHLRYPLEDGTGWLVVATTRPETMLGDCAVAVHPEDKRYQRLVGRYCKLPLTNRLIPIIADPYVDRDFGSGCVKITPAHDFNDYQVWLRHRDSASFYDQPHAGLINIFDHNAHIRKNGDDEEVFEHELIPLAYVGLDRFQARKNIVADLQRYALLEKIDDHTLMIPRGDRSNAVVEPLITDQWYVDLTREFQDDGRPGGKTVITEPSINAVRNRAIEFVPENWSRTYYQWLENIQDWCISRQLWWGHRIPAWYDDDGNIYVGLDENHVREKHAIANDINLVQDEDVLDTWFSSALWPFSTLGWPENTDRLANFYPTSVLVTGFDIIFFWVARMIMMGTRFMGDVPFHEIYIHGLIRDAHGQKMSKSKGNVLDPIDLIDGIDLASLVKKRTQGMMQPHLAEKIAAQTRNDFPDGIPSFGADALRFTFAALATNGRDINFDLSRTEGYRNFCNKIWNAARFVLINTEGQNCAQNDEDYVLSTADRWIISRFHRSVQNVEKSISKYRFDLATQEIHDLVWNKYCDWYLELSKPTLSANNANHLQQTGTRRTLARVLEAILRLTHPIIPFITEEIWQNISPLAGIQGKTIMTQPYPEFDQSRLDVDAEREMEWVMDFILGIRKVRGEMNIAPGKWIPVLIAGASRQDLTFMQRNRQHLYAIAKIASLEVLNEEQPEPESSVSLVGHLRLLIPMAGLIDKNTELTRLNKVLLQLDSEISRITGKIDNPGFITKAPSEVVKKEKDKLTDLEVRRSGLSAQRDKITSL